MENKDYYIALDLGSSNVVLMIGKKTQDNKLSIVDFAQIPVASGAVVCGEIKNISAVEKAIREAMLQIQTRQGIKIAEVYTGISGHHIKLAQHSYHVFVGSDGEIKDSDVQALNDSMRNVQAPDTETILKIFPQDYIIDDTTHVSNPEGMFGNKLEANFNFIIGNKLAVNRLQKALDKVEIAQKSLYLNALVSSQAVVTTEEKEMGVAVLDLGAGTSDLTIFVDKTMAHMSVIPVGAEQINKDIREFGFIEKYIEGIKTQYGMALVNEDIQDELVGVPGRPSMEISLKNLSTIIQARLKDILDYVQAEIKFYGFENQLRAGIIITGGGAKLKRISEFIKQYTSYDVRIATSEEYVSEDSLDIAANTSLSTVIGILLQAINDNDEPCVSVNEQVKPKQEEKPKQVDTRRVIIDSELEDMLEQEGAQDSEQEQVEAASQDKKPNVFKRYWRKFVDSVEYVNDVPDENKDDKN